MKLGDKDIKLYLGDAEVEKIYLGTEQVYGGEPTPPHDYSQDYLTFVAEADNMSVGLRNAGSNVYQYSVDSGTTWNNLTYNESTSSVNSGDTIIFKASGLTPTSAFGIGTLNPTVSASVQGNVMSLVYGDDFSGQTIISASYQFKMLFNSCTNITSAENLILPAMTLTNYCYSYMFNGCSDITTAPELPATTLVQRCYDSMFRLCSNLNYIKCLATNISANRCTNEWVNGVSSTGTFVKAASMSSWGTGISGIPNNWTVQNDDGSAVFGGEGSGNAD